MGEGESDESLYWDEKEDEYATSFMSEDFLSNQCPEPEIPIIYNEESHLKRIRLSPDSNHQEGDADVQTPLGLTLRKTPSFLSLLQKRLSKGNQEGDPSHDHNESRTNMNDLGSRQSTSEKVKASNFPATSITIGSWQRFTVHEGDLTAKLYFAKRKLVWEVLNRSLKNKIEIQWSDITAIRASTPENEPGTLEIELNQPPLFYQELNPLPKKHTVWKQTSDFTGGQASIWRRHSVSFHPGILDRHYEKLLQCDQHLFALSRKPFPSHHSPYFDTTMYGISELSLNFNSFGSDYQEIHYPFQIYPTIPRVPPLRLCQNPSTSVIDLHFRNEGGNMNHFVTHQRQTPWREGPSHNNQVYQNYYRPNIGILNGIENYLLEESNDSSHHDRAVRANVESMESLLESTNVNLSYNAADDPGTSCQYSAADQMTHGRNNNPSLYLDHHITWMSPPPQESNDNVQAMDSSALLPFFPSNDNVQAMNSSQLPPFFFSTAYPTSNTGGF